MASSTLTEIAARVIRDAGYSSAAQSPWYYNAGATTDAKLVKIYDKIREADRKMRQWFRNHAAEDLLIEHAQQSVGALGSEILVNAEFNDQYALHAGVTKPKYNIAGIGKIACAAGIVVGEPLISWTLTRPISAKAGDAIKFNLFGTCAAGSLGARFYYSDGTAANNAVPLTALFGGGVPYPQSVPVTYDINNLQKIEIVYLIAIGASFDILISDILISRNAIDTELTALPGYSAQNPGRILMVEDANGNEVPVAGFKSNPNLRLAAYKISSGVMQPNTGQSRTNYRMVFTRPGYVALLPPQSDTKVLTFYYVAAGGEYLVGADLVTGPAWYLDLLVTQAIILCYQKLSGRPSKEQQQALNDTLAEYLIDPGYGDHENELIVEEPFN